MFDETFALDLNWDTNHVSAVRELDLIEQKVDSVGNHVDAATGKMRKGFGGNLFAGVGQKIGAVTTQLKGAASQAVSTAGSMTPLGGALTGVGGALGGVALGATAAAAALVAGAFAANQMADALQDMADKLGVTTDFLQIQQGVLTLTTGSADSLEKGILKLSETYGDALGGDKAAGEKFAQLGIALTDAAGNAKSSEQIFAETTDALRGVENQSQRTALAAELFGKAGKEMGGYLSKSKEEIEALEKQVGKYGVASAAAIQASGKLGDGMDFLGGAIRAGMINAFAPLANALGNLAIKIMPLVGEAFRVLAGVMDFLAGVGSVLGDGISFLWGIFQQGLAALGNLFPFFGKLGEWLNFTGETSLSLRERWAIAMGDMIAFAGNMVGRVAGFFAGLAANVHNVIARIKNAIVDSGIGKLIGIDGKMEIKDARAARSTVETAFTESSRAAGDRVTARYRGAGNRRGDAESPDGPGGITSLGGGAGGGGAAASAAAAQADKFAEAVTKLQQAKAELNLTDQERRLLDEFERAGLERNLELTGERAEQIRALVAELHGMEVQKKVNEAVAEYERVVRESTMTADELVRVEARRRAGLTEDLTVQNEHTRAVEEAALAAERATKAVQAQAEAEDELRSMREETRDLENELREMRTADEDLYEFRLEMIEEERAAEEARLRQKYSDLEILNQLIDANNKLAQARGEVVKQDQADEEAERAQEQAEELSETMLDMWDDWRGTMKRVLGDFIKELLIAIAKATILKNIMKDTKMGGGSGGGGVGSMIANAVMSAFGGGRASGGPMSAGTQYVVTPGEKFVPATDGYMLSAADIRGMQGSGSKNINMGGITFNIQGGAQDAAQSLAQWQDVENNFRNIVRDELDRAR